jgi:hypothetical protein
LSGPLAFGIKSSSNLIKFLIYIILFCVCTQVVIPLHQLKAVNPSTSKVNSAEKYIQIISADNHEFWFMGFVYYDNAVQSLQQALEHPAP